MMIKEDLSLEDLQEIERWTDCLCVHGRYFVECPEGCTKIYNPESEET